MAVHQNYLAKDYALQQRSIATPELELDRARRAIVRLAARLAPEELGAAEEVLTALGLIPDIVRE